MKNLDRRTLMKTAGATTAALTLAQVDPRSKLAAAEKATQDSMATQLYKSLNDIQRKKICLPVDHASRQFISNWWYVHKEHRINNTFNSEQQELIQMIFDSMHSEEHQDAVNKQVEVDQYGNEKNSPSVGFYGTPEDEDFEFIYTGHHVTRRSNAHSDEGHGFGGAPIFYGHFPTDFHEKKDHPGNPYWYQGKIFNEFVQGLTEKQQAKALDAKDPRSEKPNFVITMRDKGLPGLSCDELSDDQQDLLRLTMRRMLAMFRAEDVEATMKTIEDKQMLNDLHVAYYGGKYDIGSDRVWDTWQIEGPELVWYFRGQPHIHSYLHVKT